MSDYFGAYLARGTAFAAMLRGAECTLLERAAPFTPPVLDLGCGDGFFSSLLGRPGSFLGLDPDFTVLRRAGQTGIYSSLACASATALPFASSSFGTVIANSVLEHIPDLDTALREIQRVLKPGGRLLITAPNHRFAALLAGAHHCRRAGLNRLAGLYGRWFNWHSSHFHTDDAATWTARLRAAGLVVGNWHYYFPAPAMRAFDRAHYLSLPRLLSRKLTGSWVVAPRLSLNPLYARFWRRWADPSPVDDGGCVFLDARKEIAVV